MRLPSDRVCCTVGQAQTGTDTSGLDAALRVRACSGKKLPEEKADDHNGVLFMLMSGKCRRQLLALPLLPVLDRATELVHL
jgi:hypothetical protein